ncbi:FtsK/SpoIIIE domain-containing protein [Yinghuangia seranimata]|uniref:FtsK/SpoIIIE domain-containing protein n=1 Tax=Yinghuangia seranimata TaxID=408067 RepID=UPI00248C03F2|nr:FtsK/SpoIIIE domain-containing protein [Yinghuangia seranimata]MDI2125811.1 FtsK/SpoIIIE domain-containing protein [Yinghuangia seranimata]
MEIRLSLATADSEADVLVEVAPEVTVGVLAAELGREYGVSGSSGAPPALYTAGQPMDPELTVGESPVRDGVVLGVGTPVHDAPAQGVAEIHVVSGPDAGGVHRLGPSTAVLGSGPDAWIRVADPALPAEAVEIDVAVDGTVTVRALPGAEATLDGEVLDGTVEWPVRTVLVCGHTVCERAVPTFPDTALRPAEGGGGLDFNRPPRVQPLPRQRKFQIPQRPEQGDPHPLPWLMALTPLLGALVMAYVMHTTRMLFLALLSPLSMIGMYVTNKRHGRKSYRRRLAQYQQRKTSIEQQVAHATAVETLQRRAAFPDPAKAALIATGPRQRLWERRRDDPDHLFLRVGTGAMPSEVELTDPRREEHRRQDPRTLADVPVVVPLVSAGVLGVAGGGTLPRGVGRWLVAQAAALHSPMDLRICVLTDHAGGADWEWVRWLPHSRPEQDGQAVAFVGTDAESVGRRIAELLALLTTRQDALAERNGAEGRLPDPDVLVVMDGSRRLRTVPGVTQILRDGPRVGIYAVCLDADRRLLPQECGAVVEEEWYGTLRVTRSGAAPADGVRPDAVSAAWCDDLARGLAPIRDAKNEEAAGLPDSSRLLDVLELEPPTGDAIAARWALGGRSTVAVVGESFDGAFGVDLVRDGPHGLVAGTTGSGKSELLQTIVASLAVANRPDEMTFALVDFKGGAAFKDCARLPHTVGMVTDLEARLVERALESLAAELRRREHILAAADTKDLEDYQIAMRTNPSLRSLPRLLIVIDEFAEMVTQMGEYVTALVNIARRGRSLGIHLILATQRPSGAVSPEIRANTNLRVALRVTDGAESSDVIDAPDAGRISKSTPGRAYARLGATSLLPFQSARVGGRRPGLRDDETLPPPRVVELPWSALGSPLPAAPRGTTAENNDLLTDLAVLVDAVRDANTRLGIPPQHSPWAPPLPELLTPDDLAEIAAEAGARERGEALVAGAVPGAEAPAGAGARMASVGRALAAVAPGTLAPAPYAVEDIPTEQARRVRSVDLSTFGHLLVAGAPRTGRSQLLRTIAGGLAVANSCADVHIYGLDCGNGALLALEALPHCGAVARSGDTERATRLLGKISEEVQRRMALFGELGFTDIGEQRAHSAPADKLPHLVLLLDRWEGFQSSLGALNHGDYNDVVLQLMREGASVGVHVIVTGDRTLLTGRISTLTENRMAFSMSDKGDFGLVGLPSRKAPDTLPPGRAYRVGAVELQVALLGEDPSGQAQAAELRSIAEAADERDADVLPSQRPFGVDVLPNRIEFPAAWAMRGRGTAPAPGGPLWSMVAVGGDTLAALGPDLAQGTPAFVIAGPAQSGRSTALLSAARTYLTEGTELIVFAPRESPIRELREAPGVVAMFTGTEVSAEEFAIAVDKLSGPGVVLVDDGELLRDVDAGSELVRIPRRSSRPDLGLILAGDADDICTGFTGWQLEVKKARRGLLLSPQNTMDGDLIGLRLARSLVGQPVQAGRGVMHLGDGEPIIVQVPMTRAPSAA